MNPTLCIVDLLSIANMNVVDLAPIEPTLQRGLPPDPFQQETESHHLFAQEQIAQCDMFVIIVTVTVWSPMLLWILLQSCTSVHSPMQRMQETREGTIHGHLLGFSGLLCRR